MAVERLNPNVFVLIPDAGDGDGVDITLAKIAGASNIKLLI